MKGNRRNWLIKSGMFFTAMVLAKLKLNATPTDSPNGKESNRLNQPGTLEDTMKLGAFSVSLSVKNLEASKQFYETLGFTVFGGSMAQNYLIMKSEGTLIGLFQGMFEKNILTFNPGWDQNAKNLENFTDIRNIQKLLKSKGIALSMEANESTKGPASIMLSDPDGNQILIDQHI